MTSLIISVNRYWSIADPSVYRKSVKPRLVDVVLINVCFLSFRERVESEEIEERERERAKDCSSEFRPGYLVHRFAVSGVQGDCSRDSYHSFVPMLIAQFNYFNWPFVVLCVLNMLIMINIWKRSRRISRLITLLPAIVVVEESESLVEAVRRVFFFAEQCERLAR